MRASMTLTHDSRMCSSRDFSFAAGCQNPEVGIIVSKAEGGPLGCGRCGGVMWGAVTFYERGFGFVDGHGGFEGQRQNRNGREAP